MGQALPESIGRRGRDREIRQVYEAEDFGDEFTPELREAEERLRALIAEDTSTRT